MKVLIRKIDSLRKRPARVLAMIPPAVLLTLVVRLSLWLIPFRLIRRGAEGAGTLWLMNGKFTAAQIAWLVRIASRVIFRATCLTQALTAQVLLNASGLPNQLHIGVAKGDKFESHAWVEHDGRVLVGGTLQSAQYAKILTLPGRVSNNDQSVK
jgi:hypothetical protein